MGAAVTATVTLIEGRRFSDHRGWFTETYSKARLQSIGIDIDFVQDNQSFSLAVGTLRGIHLQSSPFAQAKLIQCIKGSIFDCAVDLRKGSPTYGRFVSATLSAENGRQLFVPIGFGHGFVTLEPETEVAYKVSSPYSPEHEMGLAWDCPDIGIDWPLPPSGPILSDKDRALPGLAGFSSPFDYDSTPMSQVGDLGDPG